MSQRCFSPIKTVQLDLRDRTTNWLSEKKKSADPGLRQGRGGAWDHRRCGTCFVTAMAFTLSKASTKPCGCKLLLFQRCNLPFGAHSLCC